MMVNSEDMLLEAGESLERVQRFDVNTLPRTTELGASFSFEDVVKPASFLVSFYQRLSLESLKEFPDKNLVAIKSSADSTYNIFMEVIGFDVGQNNAMVVRNSLINKVKEHYNGVFPALYQYISYSMYKTTDFQRLEMDTRAMLQSLQDRAAKTLETLEAYEHNAKSALDEIRKVAAEEGVTKQAVHFHNEYNLHKEEAKKWRTWVNTFAVVLGLVAIGSLFLHKIPILAPQNAYDAVQLSISKALVFFVVAYMLFLSAKNYLNHQHNSIVNRHRQNALLTHTALVEASGNEGVRDAVLLQAANCIFSPQMTGYVTGKDGEFANQKSVIEILARPVAQAVKEVH